MFLNSRGLHALNKLMWAILLPIVLILYGDFNICSAGKYYRVIKNYIRECMFWSDYRLNCDTTAY